ncbi:hypothetical protein DTO013E5_4399 [Penicillium roqueforti]|uniref:uncharacterized protein n=1 Tax=Penicillium roqueforti TaxID=5082 RepID=UPI00190D20B6|nr:uncharacterized protein LCP9604111_4506 [Penicillium roqueforti]KAF9249350.1 hypothetical protein LCP9604111_4506 [Penicillium roqueforti]KAI2674928.1 hypothetical protein CBS147355_6742 [Penicillium roqueforti]KAI2688186.1 hypothetical protein LCP963914a_2588 [Penicillium roqueforti]KAI2719756.1 hypothetical protein CBS147318_3062 [Penicillium roqueforti]KAI2727105.1 hypothetical protein CBS147354_3823 [Penicillium roqueforti]
MIQFCLLHRHQPPTPPFHLHRLSQVVDTPSHPKLPVSVVGITVTVAAGTRVQLRSTLVSIIAGISGRFSSHSTKVANANGQSLWGFFCATRPPTGGLLSTATGLLAKLHR